MLEKYFDGATDARDGGYARARERKWWEDHELMYVHCGGLEGNVSQLNRYERKGLHKGAETG
jgi:hypothetical protein